MPHRPATPSHNRPHTPDRHLPDGRIPSSSTTGGSRHTVPRWLRIIIPAALILVWFVAFSMGGSYFGKISEVSSNDAAQHLPAGAEATQVQELQTKFRGSDLIPGIVVYQRDGGLTETDMRAIDEQIAVFGEVAGVAPDAVSPPIRSTDGEAVEVFVPMDSTVKVSDTVAEVRAHLASSTPAGLSAHLTGPAGLSADIGGAFSGLDGMLLLVALAAVLLILIVVYRSPLLPIIVLGTSMAALTAAIVTVWWLAKAEIVLLTGQTQGILLILVVGAATDYSLLYVARYREALRDHEGTWQATWAALKGSWQPILASGGTVIIGLMCLLFSDLNSNKALGPVASIGIAFALLGALTLLPALLMWAGRAAFWPIRPAFGSDHPATVGRRAAGVWPKLGAMISRRPRMIWVASTLVLLVASLGMLQLKADGVPSSEFVLGASQARDGQAVLAAHFPAGSGTPAVIIGQQADFDEIAQTVLGTAGVTSVNVISADSKSGTLPVDEAGIKQLGKPGSPPSQPTVVNGQVMLQATLDAAGDSAEAEQTVRDLRTELSSVGADSSVLVGGVTAVALDTNTASVHDRNLIIPLVLVVILAVLMLLLRSIVAPLILISTVVISYLAALGVSALVFNHLFGFPGADPSVPMFGFIFLVALGIDYNIFLMTRVREESTMFGTRLGILRGLSVTGGVITSAGLVLAATFAALGVLPVLFMAQISFIVAFGVLVDTFLVRSLLVPALSYDIGRRIWWPSKLAETELPATEMRNVTKLLSGNGDSRAD